MAGLIILGPWMAMSVIFIFYLTAESRRTQRILFFAADRRRQTQTIFFISLRDNGNLLVGNFVYGSGAKPITLTGFTPVKQLKQRFNGAGRINWIEKGIGHTVHGIRNNVEF